MRWHGVCALLLGASPAWADAPGWTLDRLMQALHGVRSASARFVERHEIAALDAPLVSSGTLVFVAPDQLQKVTLTPSPARLTVVGDRLTIEQQGETPRTLSVSGTPEVGALVAGIRATLAGDAAGLSRFYSLDVSGEEAGWSLRLVPRDPRLRAMVREVRIDGAHAQVARIETIAPGGDRTVMTITADR